MFVSFECLSVLFFFFLYTQHESLYLIVCPYGPIIGNKTFDLI